MSHIKPTNFESGETINIDLPLILDTFKTNRILIVCIMLIGITLGGFCALFLYQERFTSTATILLNPIDFSTLGNNKELSFFKGIGTGSDPFKNQEELLRSRYLAKRVFQKLKATKQFPNLRNPDQLDEDVLSVSRVLGSDFISVQTTWHSPKHAQLLAQTYLQSYEELTEEISHAPVTHEREVLQKQVEKAEAEGIILVGQKNS